MPCPEPGGRFVTCSFCNATTDLETGAHEGEALDGVPFRTRYKAELAAFESRFRERIGHAEPVIAAFHGAVEDTLAKASDPDALTNVTFGLAADFFQQSAVDVTRDPMLMERLLSAYIQTVEVLANATFHGHKFRASSVTVTMPVTAAGADPPRFQVTIERLRELAATPAALPNARPRPPSPGSAPNSPSTKQSWWKKILG